MRSSLAAAVVTILLNSPAYSDIVLDDFDLSASAESPLMANDFVVTENVGPFSALRQIRILGSTTDPTGTLDASDTTASVLTADLTTSNPRDRASSGFQFWYNFDSADLSNGGQNNAVFVDFLETRTSDTPISTRVLIGRANTRVDTPISEDPFTLAIPFSEISTNLDFSQVPSLHFSVTTPQPPGGVDFDLLASIERVRLGFLVPEPSVISLLAAASLCATVQAWRARRSASGQQHARG